MKERYAEFRRLDAEVLAVSFAPPHVVAAFLAESPTPFPVLSDPTREAYRALGLGRTTWTTFLHGGVVGRYLRLMLRGWLPHRSSKGEDLLQLGGDFVLDGRRRIVYIHRSAEPTDRPSVDEVLCAVGATVEADKNRKEESSIAGQDVHGP